MDDIKEMFRTLVNGQSAMKEELLGEIRKLDRKVDSIEQKMNNGFANVDVKLSALTKRIDVIGLQVARLEDNTPTREEFEKLDTRVGKLEQEVASV